MLRRDFLTAILKHHWPTREQCWSAALCDEAFPRVGQISLRALLNNPELDLSTYSRAAGAIVMHKFISANYRWFEERIPV